MGNSHTSGLGERGRNPLRLRQCLDWVNRKSQDRCPESPLWLAGRGSENCPMATFFWKTSTPWEAWRKRVELRRGNGEKTFGKSSSSIPPFCVRNGGLDVSSDKSFLLSRLCIRCFRRFEADFLLCNRKVHYWKRPRKWFICVYAGL